ncbi:MAG: 4-(cytidine 5'-diphospho)-2-C-methyl-D-erythritol kinase [Solirubrobacteraceae bacterium]
MRRLRAVAPAKINLGLFVGRARGDGRHELVSVMQSISLADELTLELAPPEPPASKPSHPEVADEVLCPGFPELASPHNLAARALAAFRRDTGWDPGPLRLTIDKRVPVAAGMGGGSGDAAAALRLAAHASGLGDRSLLRRIAAGLGADVPAQVEPGRWLALGAGERLEALPDPAEPFGVLVLPLAQALSTAAVYAEADRLGVVRSAERLTDLRGRIRGAFDAGVPLPAQELLHNDLQQPAVSLCPPIADALAHARAAGADTVLVSGSGPTVLGLFGTDDGPERAHAAAARLAGRHPRAVAAVPVGSAFAHVAPVRNNEPLNPQQ